MRNFTTEITANDFHETKVTVDDVIAYINSETVFTAKELKNKDRVAVYDSNNKKCAEIAYRNKKDSFSTALQCNRFKSENVRLASDTVKATYKYHECKNNRNYMTSNNIDASDMIKYMFYAFDSIIDDFD